MGLPSLTIVLAAQPRLAEETASIKIRVGTDKIAVATREVLGRIRLIYHIKRFRVDHGFQHIRVRAVVSGLRAGFCAILAQAPPLRRAKGLFRPYRAEARGARQPKSILGQNVNLAKLFLDLLDPSVAAGMLTSSPCADYGRPAILAGHDCNVCTGRALIERP